MHFIDFLSTCQSDIIKKDCHLDCDFRYVDYNVIPVVGILPPLKLKGVIISRDPTTDFIDVYRDGINNNVGKRSLILGDAPPQWLLSNIDNFRCKFMDSKYEDELEILKVLIETNVYWTHLHKCCTYNKNDNKLSKNNGPAVKIPFKFKNARRCANTWLKEELQDAVEQGATFVICLGKHAERCVYPWMSQLNIPAEQVFYLPHPSGAANGEWFNDERVKEIGLEEKIRSLFMYCRKI